VKVFENKFGQDVNRKIFQFRFVLSDLSGGQGIHRGHQEIPAWQASPRPPGAASCLIHMSLIRWISLFSCPQKISPWQFKNNPKYRIYKVYKHTEHKSGPGLIEIKTCLHFHLLLIIIPLWDPGEFEIAMPKQIVMPKHHTVNVFVLQQCLDISALTYPFCFLIPPSSL